MRYFIDTEFLDEEDSITLISIALVREDGEFLYRVNQDSLRKGVCEDAWIAQNVLPKLPWGQPLFRPEHLIKFDIMHFIGDDIPEFWAYFCAYDFVLFCKLFGTMMDLPPSYPSYCNDLVQWANHLKVSLFDLPAPDKNQQHCALYDARWDKSVYEYLSNSTYDHLSNL